MAGKFQAVILVLGTASLLSIYSFDVIHDSSCEDRTIPARVSGAKIIGAHPNSNEACQEKHSKELVKVECSLKQIETHPPRVYDDSHDNGGHIRSCCRIITAQVRPIMVLPPVPVVRLAVARRRREQSATHLYCESSHQQQDNDNDEHKTQAAARIITPARTIWPRR